MSTSLLLGWGAYARDKNTSARLCAKNAGGAYARGGGGGGGGVFAGHYGICMNLAALGARNALWRVESSIQVLFSRFL